MTEVNTEAVNLFKELVTRLRTESPDLFKKIQWIVGIILLVIPILLGADHLLELGIGDFVLIGKLTVHNLLVTAETFLALIFTTAKIPVKSTDELNEKIKSSKKAA